MTEPSVETVNKEEEIRFDNLTTTGDYMDYGILEGKQETISRIDIVWVKVKKEIFQRRVIQIPYSIK